MRKYFNNILISGFALILPFTGSIGLLDNTNDIVYQSEAREPIQASQQVNTANTTNEVSEWVDELEKYDWNVEIAKKVVKEESRFKKTAFNPEWHKRIDGTWCQGSYGPFQIACLHYDGPSKDLYDPELNIKIAYRIYKNQGVDEWGVCTDGKVDCSNW